MIERANIPQSIHVYPVDWHVLPFHEATLDCIYFFEPVQKSANWRALFSEIYRVLRPGGLLYVSRKSLMTPLATAGDDHRVVPGEGDVLASLYEIGFLQIEAGMQPVSKKSLAGRSAYVAVGRERLTIAELESPSQFAWKSPFFETAVCLTKPA